jgi:acyl carrier protein
MNAEAFRERALDAIYKSLDEINEQRPKNRQIPKAPDTVLMGAHGNVDSLELINLIVGVEQRIQEGFGVSITLSDQMLSQENSALQTVDSMTEHLLSILGSNHAG